MAVYLDFAASAPLREEILANYLEQLKEIGNPSSVHSSGQRQRQRVEEARERLAKVVNCHRSEVLFTSGGTESDNIAIKGIYLDRHTKDSNRNVIIVAGTEHHAGIDPVEWLVTAEGAEIAWLPVDATGMPDLVWLKKYLVENSSRIAMISAMWANNETGVVWPIAEIAELAREFEIPVHSDAVAAFGHIPVDFAKSGLSTMAISGPKIGAPVGVGALIVARDAKLVITSHGGGQERGIRSGTLSAPLAIAFADAADLAAKEMNAEAPQIEALRDRLVRGVLEIAPDAVFSRGTSPGLPGTANFTFPGCSGDSLLFLLDNAGVSVSTGSACRAGVAQPSHVLMAMGRTEAEAYGALRISLGHGTTDADIDEFLKAFPAAHAGAKKAGLSAKS